MTAAPSPRRDDDDDASRPPASRSPPPASPNAPASPTAPGDADAPDDEIEIEIFATPGGDGDGTGAGGDDRAADAATGAEAAAPPDDSDPLDAAFANARAETDAALHAMNDWVASAQEEAEHAAKEAERLAQDAAEAVSGLFGDAFAWGAAEPVPVPEPVPEPERGSGDPTATGARANDPSREANARASDPEDPDPETDPMLAELSAGFSSLWTDAETAMRDAAMGAEALLAGGPAEDEKPAALAPPDREENFGRRVFGNQTVSPERRRTSATRRRSNRPVALKPGELRAAFPSLPRGAVVVGDFACELQLRYALEVPAALAGRVRGARDVVDVAAPCRLLITDRHACFAFDRETVWGGGGGGGGGEGVGEGYSHSSSGSERFGPENFAVAHEEILGTVREEARAGVVGFSTRVAGSGPGGEEASGEEGSLRLVGFEDAAESDAAMALLEHLRESTER